MLMTRSWHRPSLFGIALLAMVTLWILTAARSVEASPVEVVNAVFQRSGGNWYVSVALRHDDSGWEHYANVWVVETPQGKELGRRVLLHPHETEQPFTRSQSIKVPQGVSTVQVRAGDNVNGINSNTVTVNLSAKSGERFQIR